MIIEDNTFPGLALTRLIVLRPPFKANPDENPLEPGQRVGDDWGRVPEMVATLDVPGTGMVRVSGHVGFQIANLGGSCAHEDRLLIGVALAVNGRRVDGTQANSNVPRSEHYYDAPFSWAFQIPPGRCEVEVQARAHPKGKHDCVPCFKEGQYSRMQVEIFQPLVEA